MLALVATTGAMFVSNLSESTTLDALRNHFGGEGALEDCVLLTDKLTGKSKQCGFVTFSDPSVAKAVMSKGQSLEGRTLRMAPRERPNREGAVGGSTAGPARNDAAAVLVRSPIQLTDDMLRKTFASCGRVVKVRVFPKRTETDTVSVGLVQFTDENAARKAATNLNGKPVGADKRLTVRVSTDKPPSREGGDRPPREGGDRRAQREKPEKGARGDEPVMPRREERGPGERQSRVFQTRHEIEILDFFNVYVLAVRGDNWAKVSKARSKGAPRTRMHREMTMAEQKPDMNLEQLMHNLHLGATFVGATRARLLLHWYTLLQASEKEDRFEFHTPSGATIDFKQAFILSNCIENLVIQSLDHPFSEAIPVGALPDTCRLTVPMLMSRILLKTLVGGAELHDTLLESLERLAQLPHVLPATLKNNVGRLVSGFKAEVSTWGGGVTTILETAESVNGDLALEKRRRVRQELGLTHPPSIEDLPPPGMSESMVAAHGFASHRGMRAVFDGLSSEIGEITKASVSVLSKCQHMLSRCDAEDASLNALAAQESAQLDAQLAALREQDEAINQRKMAVKAQTKVVLDELSTVAAEQARLGAAKEDAASKISPLLSELKKKKSTIQENATRAGDGRVALQQLITMVNRSHQFLCSQVNQARISDLGMAASDLNLITASTVTAVNRRLEALIDDVAKKQKKASFCRGKLSSMSKELTEMQKLGFYDVADDLDRGINKLTTELQSINNDVNEKVAEAEALKQWLQSLENMGLVSAESTSTLGVPFSQLAALQPGVST